MGRPWKNAVLEQGLRNIVHSHTEVWIQGEPGNGYSSWGRVTKLTLPLLVISYCPVRRKDSLWVSRKGRRSICRVLRTWQLLGLSVKWPWLALRGPILTLVARMGLESVTLT